MKPTIGEATGAKPFLSRRRVPVVRRLFSLLAGLGVAGFAFLLYLRTLAPTVLHYERPGLIDAAMFQAQAYVLGIPHQSGYPTYTMLAHLFTYLPIGDPAYRANLASAVFGAATVALIFSTGLRLTGRPLAAAVGALAFGAGETFWSQAVIAEVYTLNAALVSLVLLVLFRWRDTKKDRYLLAAAFCMGLALTNHITSGLLLPASALFVLAVDRRKLLDKRLILKGAGLLALGLLPYLYLPIRAHAQPPMREADLTGPVKFLEFVSGRELTVNLATFGLGEIPSRLGLFWGYLIDEFHWALLLVAAFGFLVMLARDRAGALLLGFLFVGWLAYAAEYDIFDFYIYFLPPYLVLALFMAVGAGAFLTGAERFVARYPFPPRAAALLLSVPLLYLAVSDVGEDYPKVDRSRDVEGRRIVETVAEKTAPNATVLHHRSPLWYMVLVEGRRRDLTLISPWYPSRNPTRSWSDPDKPEADRVEVPEAPSVGNTGAVEAEEAAKKGPVYALVPGVDLCKLRDAGFSIVSVEEGLLYEVVQPGHEPYSHAGSGGQETAAAQGASSSELGCAG